MGWKSFLIGLWGPLTSLLSTLAWPAAFLLAAWWSRPLIARLGEALGQGIANRDFKFKLGNMLEASMAVLPQQSTAPELPAPDSEPTGETITKAPSQPAMPLLSERPLINQYISEVQGQLGDAPDAQKVALLTRWIADLRATAVHEFLFNRIFASQILLLNQMNLSGGSLLRPVVQAHFSTVVAAHPNLFRADQMDSYLHFLVGYDLALWQGETFSLTALGKDFLVYMVNASLNPAAKAI